MKYTKEEILRIEKALFVAYKKTKELSSPESDISLPAWQSQVMREIRKRGHAQNNAWRISALEGVVWRFALASSFGAIVLFSYTLHASWNFEDDLFFSSFISNNNETMMLY